ncbi:hypothetical protein, partial [Roseobacter sp.]|uniref:hypothetical protein n=1 Tax=Roseobacter sp. TaxID=1907202 RepID=UPI00385D9C15
VEDHAFRILAAFEVNRHRLIPALKYKGLRLTQLDKNAHVSKTLRQNRQQCLEQFRVGIVKLSALLAAKAGALDLRRLSTHA